MSKAALEALMRGVTRYSTIKRQLRGVTTPGELYRKSSFEAPHTVLLSKKSIREQLVSMITDPTGLNLQTLSGTKIDKLTDKVFDNIVTALESKGFKYNRASSSFYVRGDKGANNYRKISEAFNQAFGGNRAYGPFFDFLREELSGSPTYAGELQHVQSFHDSLSTKDLKGYGFDVGHMEANITAVFKASVWNSLKEDFRTSDSDFRNDSKLAEDLLALENEWLKIINNSTAEGVLQQYLITHKIVDPGEDPKALLAGFFEHTLGFARKIASGEAQAVLKIESKLKDKASLQKIAREVVVTVMPEYGKANQDKGSKLEKAIMRQLEVIGASSEKRLSSILSDWVSGNLEIPGMPSLQNLPGSKTLNQLIGESLWDILKTGKAKPVDVFTPGKVSATAKVNKGTPAKMARPIPLGLDKKPVGKIDTIRSLTGRFTSIVNVVNIINMQLAEKIRQNMGSPRLNYRTGRFAQSAKVLTPTTDVDGAVRLPYTYMKYPYQTFEPGFARGTNARDPRTLINKSVREIAQTLVTSKLRIVRV